MLKNSFSVRTMKRDELGIAIQWAANEGWNPGIYDKECFYSAYPNGFFIGILGDTPVSTISAVAYDDTFCFIGFYIVKPEFRDKGFGMQTWQKAMDYLKTQNIGLDGVVAQQENYKKSGFKLAYRNIRHQGKSKKYSIGLPVMKAADVSFEKLRRYDLVCFPCPREKFLRLWINQPDSHALYVEDQAGKLLGYGIIRKCQTGYKIGPLFADNKMVAENLFRALNNFLAPDTLFFLDIPQTNPAAVGLTLKYKMISVFETARMYTKKPPLNDINKVFGVTTFEVG